MKITFQFSESQLVAENNFLKTQETLTKHGQHSFTLGSSEFIIWYKKACYAFVKWNKKIKQQ